MWSYRFSADSVCIWSPDALGEFSPYVLNRLEWHNVASAILKNDDLPYFIGVNLSEIVINPNIQGTFV